MAKMLMMLQVQHAIRSTGLQHGERAHGSQQVVQQRILRQCPMDCLMCEKTDPCKDAADNR